jgi:transposase, IS5 family
MNGFEQYTKKTRRQIFLEEMEQVVPWRELCALIEPHYPKPGNGRPPVGVERMLRIYFLQQWFNLSDPAVEEALYDSPVMRQFVGIDLGQEPSPDETTVCKFRHLLEEHRLGEKILGTVNLHLQARGVRITTGTIVDATILYAPTSTKNREQQRDPEMHQTKKGNQWYFGMKAHVGVDSKTKIIHTAVATPAHVADSRVLPDLLHGEETRVWGDQAYRGQTEVIQECAPRARSETYLFRESLTSARALPTLEVLDPAALRQFQRRRRVSLLYCLGRRTIFWLRAIDPALARRLVRMYRELASKVI